MDIEIINSLKQRAKEMLENNYNRKIGYEEVYTIICELENFYTAYEKEKDTSHYNKSQLDIANAKLIEEKEKNNKAKWKPIKDYDRKKYDWVLVKYFDGDYECVPEVAEKRNDGKWYTSEKQIPFEVKYFFDMQEILEEK